MTLQLGAKPNNVMVPYLDLGGGLDTVTDTHALERNQLAQSVNCWHAYGRSLSKRPGSQPFGSATGATGAGGTGAGCATARFAGHTYVVAQVNGKELYSAKSGDVAWTHIGTMSNGAGSISAAQMYDPGSAASTLFIVNGVDFPLAWQGPGHSLVAASTLTGASLPLNLSGGAIITPAYIAVYQNYLMYAGETTAPEAVYVSNPFFPNAFTTPGSTVKIGSDPTYEPYYVGFNDGVNGGDITGLLPLEAGVIILKQAAIYGFTLTGLYGDTIFYPQLISGSTGCSSPKSVVRFDGYGCFLAIDGVYTVSLSSPPQMISEAVATYFDSTLAGYQASITNAQTAVGVRHGNRYILFFSSGRTAYNNDTGMWFDFKKRARNGMPTCGEIDGMQVAGAAALRGPNDDGNFVWVDSSLDRVSKFGFGFNDPIPGSAGYTNPITAQFVGKSDFLEDLYPHDGLLRPKRVQKVWLVLSLFGRLSSGIYTGSLTFNAAWFGGGSSGVQTESNTQTLPVNIGNTSVWGDNWGQMIWSGVNSAAQPYAMIPLDGTKGMIANNCQIGFTEASSNGWVVIGYIVELEVEQPIRNAAQRA